MILFLWVIFYQGYQFWLRIICFDGKGETALEEEREERLDCLGERLKSFNIYYYNIFTLKRVSKLQKKKSIEIIAREWRR